MDDGLQYNAGFMSGVECKEFYDIKAKKEALDRKKIEVLLTDEIYNISYDTISVSRIKYKPDRG